MFIEIVFRWAQVFLFLYSEVKFFLPYHLRWYFVILDNLSSCFMIHMLLRMRYFKPINLFIEVILGYISPKAFPKDFAIFYMMVHQGFNSFSKCSLRLFSDELKYSSSCIPKWNSFYRIIWGGILSFLIIWVHVSWFTCC